MLYLVYVGTTLSIILILSMILAYQFKDRLAGMNAMIISMYIGMNIGLTSGILLGTYHQGDLFTSTLLAMGIGATSGTVLGILFGPVSSIEGFMSGIMGGMMGAMLGEMLLPEKALILTNIFLTISISTLFFFKVLPRTRTTIKSLKEFFKPMLVFIFLLAYLLLGSRLGVVWLLEIQRDLDHHQHLQLIESPGH
ncbi:hypothetical protein M3204_01760 [Mesobacillus subterraneus]|uniref:hypothetical protein n=1 Tax=Mesobacillus subterraneus TaxID=285983 RepID=UPI00203E7147|nr:hypothetical protein [Mesobacillus subterraneus]MCM3663111.1 hypothetical protein [Mesobacillus subterraneus]MCM3682713.1 hypothetical protein [Mesobacillus subterraneus]